MPITRNVAWDGRLELFKGKDSTQYVSAAASAATACGTCGQKLSEDEQLAMSVDVSITHGPDGADYRAFDCCVCHRGCCVPDVRVHERAGVREELTSAGAMMVLHYKEAGRTRRLPALVFTLLPSLTFAAPGAEYSSVLVSLLLGQGFQLALGGDLDLILGQATDVKPGTSCTLGPQGLLVLQVAGQPMYTHLLDREDPDGAAWLEAAAHSGAVLVLGGDNLAITQAAVDLAPAAKLATLVAGLVPIRAASPAADAPAWTRR
jgi:hypothetical protein